MTKLLGVTFVVAVAGVLVGRAGAAAVLSDTPLWTAAPGSQPFLANDNSARGLSYNPTTGNLVVVSRTGGPGVYILNGQTGALVGNFNLGSAATGPGTFPVDMVGVSDDGAIFVGNLSTNTASTTFNLYCWPSESYGLNSGTNGAPVLVYSGDPTNGLASTATNDHRFGDSLDATGAGTGTKVLIGSRGGNLAAVLSPDTSLAAFKATTITTDAAAGNLSVSLEDATHYWTKAPSADLRRMTISGSSATTSNDVTGLPAKTTPLAVDPANKLLALVNYDTVAPNPSVTLYDISDPNNPVAIGTRSFGTNNVNGNGVGQVDFGNGVLYAMDTNNGIVAYSVSVPEPSAIAVTAAGAGLLLRRRRA